MILKFETSGAKSKILQKITNGIKNSINFAVYLLHEILVSDGIIFKPNMCSLRRFLDVNLASSTKTF